MLRGSIVCNVNSRITAPFICLPDVFGSFVAAFRPSPLPQTIILFNPVKPPAYDLSVVDFAIVLHAFDESDLS